MHFGTKSYLKSTRNHIAKHALSLFGWYCGWGCVLPQPQFLVCLVTKSNSAFGTSTTDNKRLQIVASHPRLQTAFHPSH
jgi:hypothetical protein